jgi:hypothetical protein
LSISRRVAPAITSGSATLSNTLRSYSSLWSWNTTPSRCRNLGIRRRGIRAVFWSFTSTVPRVGRSISAMSRSTVLLPAPDGPVRNASSPRSMLNVTPESASRPPS